MRRHTPVIKATRDPYRASPSSTSSANLRSAAPQYHFHGLAATQTDSQIEESQPPPGLGDPSSTSASPQKLEWPPSKGVLDPKVGNTNGSSMRRSLSPDVARVKCGREDAKGTSRYAPQSRTSLSSDSFAEPLPRKAAVFPPRRELTSPEIPKHPLDESQDSLDNRSRREMSPASYPSDRSQSFEVAQGQPTDSQSYGMNDDSIYGDIPFAQAQDPDLFPSTSDPPPLRPHSASSDRSSSAPSSSYYRLIDGHPDDDINRRTPDAAPYQETQPSTPVATQPTSDEPSQPSAYRDTPITKPKPLPVQPAVSNMTGTSAFTGNSIFGLVDPAKRWRLQGFLRQQETPIVETQPNTSVIATFANDTVMEETQLLETPSKDESVVEETQPMEETQIVEEETQPSEEPSIYPRRQLPFAQPSTVASSHARMEVISDSEPEDHVPPRRSPTATPVIETRKTFRQLSASTVSEGESSAIPGLSIPDNIPLSLSLRQEVEESSEDDTPLAVTASIKPGSKGSKPTSSKSSKEPTPKATTPIMPPPRVPTRGASSRTRGVLNKTSEEVHNRSWDTTVVPSSEPNESVAQASQPPVTQTNPAPRQASRQNSKPPSRTRPACNAIPSTSTLNSITPARRFDTRSTVDTELESVGSDEVMPPPSDTPEQPTEMGDDDAMDTEPESEPEVQNTRTKRKRMTSSTTKVKKEARSVKRKASATPSRAPKRFKSEPNTNQATRVFALWKSDNVYYSGVVHEISKSSAKRFLVKFDDGDEDWTDLSKLRACHLRTGDHILFGHDQGGVVVDADGDDPHDLVTIETPKGSPQKMKIRDIKIPGRSVVSQWKDRTLTIEEIVPVVRPKIIKPSPALSKMSLASAGSTKSIRSKVLARTGFVVTSCPGNEQWDQDKNKALQSIKLSGGQVFDDWDDIFKMDGKLTQNSKRWVINEKDVSTMKLAVDRVFLLSDHSNHKPKFLLALALGIPCLSFEWLEACLREVCFISV